MKESKIFAWWDRLAAMTQIEWVDCMQISEWESGWESERFWDKHVASHSKNIVVVKILMGESSRLC